MTYGSVCAGIEAASVAWRPLGFRPAWFAEIDPFCSALLAERYPEVNNLGDFTKIGEQYGPIDLLVGGTPCQSFSTAGKRGGLDDGRGNLAIEFCRLASRLRPRWVVWENVPGVLSLDRGRDFGAILRHLAELGYGCVWRVLDAQFFGVPQWRRRVFLVGHLGDWRRSAAVLLERNSLRWSFTPRGKIQKDFIFDNTPGFTRNCGEAMIISPALTLKNGPAFGETGNCIITRDSSERLDVRRLTPRECERLQGFPDDYTLIQYRGKPAADTPRYRAIGNSMAVPVMRWIGRRIQMVDSIAGGDHR